MKILTFRFMLSFPFMPFFSPHKLSGVIPYRQAGTKNQAGHQKTIIHKAPDQKYGEHGHANANFGIICHRTNPKTFNPIPNRVPLINRIKL